MQQMAERERQQEAEMERRERQVLQQRREIEQMETRKQDLREMATDAHHLAADFRESADEVDKNTRPARSVKAVGDTFTSAGACKTNFIFTLLKRHI
jgi:hypothetical protein